jgi:hypothetical protein
MIKWIAISIIAIISLMIATGNMGGATKATDNYVKVRGG